jgi:hypothetical protein
LLATASGTVTGGHSWQGFDFPTPPSVIAGLQYTYRMTIPAVMGSWVDVNIQDPYSGGRADNIADWDLLFRTYVAPLSPAATTLLVKDGVVNVKDVLNLNPRSSPPDNPRKGDLYFDDNTNQPTYYNGSSWVAL